MLLVMLCAQLAAITGCIIYIIAAIVLIVDILFIAYTINNAFSGKKLVYEGEEGNF